MKQMVEEQDKGTKLNQLLTDKIRKDMTVIKKQLAHERNLKLDAFQRVDKLQTQVGQLKFVNCSKIVGN